MKKTRWMALLIMTAMIASLTGCAENQIPVMTDEQIYDVSEYVAITLMKYDASNRSRLVELDEDDFIEKEPVVTPEPEDVGMKPVEDTPVIDATTGQEIQEQEPVETVLALPEGLKLTYLGYEITDSYPNDGENSYFSLLATRGNKLLVLKFEVTNTSDAEVAVDLLSSDERFLVTVNGEYTRRALTTMLDNDLTTYMGTLKGMEGADAVLLIEVSEEVANSISSVDIKVQNEDKTHTIQAL